MSIQLAIAHLKTAQKLDRIVKQEEKAFSEQIHATVESAFQATKKNARRIKLEFDIPKAQLAQVRLAIRLAVDKMEFKKFGRTYQMQAVFSDHNKVVVDLVSPTKTPAKKSKPTMSGTIAKAKKETAAAAKAKAPKTPAKPKAPSKERVAAGWTEKSLRNKAQRELFAKFSKLPANKVTELFEANKLGNAPRMSNKTQRLVYMIHIGGKAVQALTEATK